ncbi:MAG: hypothetical protein RL033_2769 [Pseudomonadota bacterium]|jgi:16S rRNA (guanine527-N7)-methyltransferase
MLPPCMGETLQAPRGGWPPLIERALASLVCAPALPSLWSASAPRAAAVQGLSRLLDLVALWNQRVDLTAARSVEELVDLYLIDALVLAAAEPVTSEQQRWLDVGSGAGAPGLVVQVLRPSVALTLVEPRAKRVAFLRTAIGQLRLGAQLESGRSDQLPARTCDVAFSRATFPPAEWLAEGARLARHAVWVLLARGEVPELTGWQLERELSYEWPLTSAPRRALRYVPASDVPASDAR